MYDTVQASPAVRAMLGLTAVPAAAQQAADARNQSAEGYAPGSENEILKRVIAIVLTWQKVLTTRFWNCGKRIMARLSMLVLGLVVLLTGVPASLWGQNDAAPGPETSANATGAPSKHSSSDQPVLQQRYPRYKVQPTDVLSLTFPLSPEFNQTTVNVQPDGYINLLIADSVYVKGKTVPEITQVVKKAYLGTLHDPIIEVDLVDFQKPFFLVSGQVGKPGQFDLLHDTTVSEAIAIAGGFAPTAKTQVFLFHRVSNNWVEVKKLSLKDILHGKNANEDAQLASGDMIFVPEKFITNFRKYVPYAISGSAGTYLTNP
jgi:polysaccharide biosynthesis/export protein